MLNILNLRFNILIIILSALLLFSMGVVCAQKNNTNIDDIVIQGTYGELEKEINNLEPGETITLTQDYQYNEKEYNSQNYIDGITIHKNNITINGNNHTLNSKNTASFFKITGDNVKIINLNMINSQKKNQISIIDNNNPYLTKTYNNNPPITWIGNHGTLENCTLQNNTIINNGILKIQGEKNNIKNIKFINNTINKYGATIYLKNNNNNIMDCIFINTPSNTYIYTNKTNTTNNISPTIKNIYNSSLDLDCLNYKYKNNIVDITSDLIQDIYQTLLNPGNVIIKDSYTIKGDIIDTKYILTYNKNLKDDILFVKEYHIINIKNNNLTSIYNQLFKNEYFTTYALIKNIHFNNTSSYEGLLKLKVSDVFNKSMIEYCQKADKDYITLGLNISLADHYIINSNSTWDITSTGFDFINFNGNGSTIKASSKLKDEHTWLLMDYESGVVNILNLTITGFNTAIDNRGGHSLMLFNTVLKDNKKDYTVDMDYGAGIINTGKIFCYNCTFMGNYAKYGGAIFNQGNLEIINCTFKDNKGYGTGDNILNAKQGNVTINGVLTLHNEDNTNSSLINYREGSNFEGSEVLAYVSYIIGVGCGFMIGAFIPGLYAMVFLGALSGTLLGAGIGASAVAVFFSNSFDVTLNRKQIALSTIGSCAISGCMGGSIGGLCGFTYFKVKQFDSIQRQGYFQLPESNNRGWYRTSNDNDVD